MCMESGAVALKQTAFQLLYAVSWALIQLERSDQSSLLPSAKVTQPVFSYWVKIAAAAARSSAVLIFTTLTRSGPKDSASLIYCWLAGVNSVSLTWVASPYWKNVFPVPAVSSRTISTAIPGRTAG